MSIRVSIDPGNATGVCVWVDGKVWGAHPVTLRAKGHNYLEGIFSLREQLGSLFGSICPLEPRGIEAIAVEDFVNQYAAHDAIPNTKTSMIKCGTTRGMILSVAMDFCKTVILVSKGAISKEQTRQLAKVYGIDVDATYPTGKPRHSKDALDAFQIGICAGFDQKQWRKP